VTGTLRDPQTIDTEGVWDAAASLPEQVEAAVRERRDLSGLPAHDYVENVVVLGMGGSGIAGDVLVAVAGPFLPVPVTVVKGYELPDFVGRGSLVFAISFSGDSEETIEATTEAFEAGAHLVAVTSGGALGRLAEEWEAPSVLVPGHGAHPRTSLGAMAIPPLLILEQVGLFPGASEWAILAVDQLKSRRDEIFSKRSPAREIASRIGRTIPVIHGAHAVGATASLRWKSQINANAKTPAFHAVYPEIIHGDIAGWGQNGDVTRQVATIVNLRHYGEHPQVSRSFELVRELLDEVVADIIDVEAQGEGDLAQLLDLAMIGDFVSLTMAADQGVDPGPLPVVTDLLSALRSGS
jgi:glucose/mannose-6-phosphate isomerase